MGLLRGNSARQNRGGFAGFLFKKWLSHSWISLCQAGEIKFVVVDSFQEKPLRGSGWASHVTVFGFNDVGNPVRRSFPAAYFYQRPDNVADHVVKKSVCFDFDRDSFAGARQVQTRLVETILVCLLYTSDAADE